MAAERNEDHEVTYEINEHLGDLADKQRGWKRELNLVTWNGGVTKYDIRDWSPDHKAMGRGITLLEEEMAKVVESYNKYQNQAAR